jgi:hypothetical protein
VRFERPVIQEESNNPAILQDGEKIKLIYRDASLRVFLAEADQYAGPYSVVNDNVWPEGKIEDFYLYKSQNQYHIICEDNVGQVSGHVRWGVHLVSDNGISGWKRHDQVVVYDHDLRYDDGDVLHCVRRERPQLLIDKKRIIGLITSIYDGRDTWSQPVMLKKPIKLD